MRVAAVLGERGANGLRWTGWYTEVKHLEVDFVRSAFTLPWRRPKSPFLNVQIDYNEESMRYNIGVSAIVRVWLRDGASHEDVGYGKLENSKSKADGLDKVSFRWSLGCILEGEEAWR